MDNQREDFEAWFKTTKWYTGDNCTPKYRTYRSMLQAWQQAQKMVVPDGFVLMPLEIDDFDHPIAKALEKGIVKDLSASVIYKAMIEAGEKG